MPGHKRQYLEILCGFERITWIAMLFCSLLTQNYFRVNLWNALIVLIEGFLY